MGGKGDSVGVEGAVGVYPGAPRCAHTTKTPFTPCCLVLLWPSSLSCSLTLPQSASCSLPLPPSPSSPQVGVNITKPGYMATLIAPYDGAVDKAIKDLGGCM